MAEVPNREDLEPGVCIRFDTIDYIVWSRKAAGKISWEYVDHAVGVGDIIFPVLSGNFLIYEVKVTHLWENSPGFSTSLL